MSQSKVAPEEIPYYLAGLPLLTQHPAAARRTYWTAMRGGVTMAGHSPHERCVVREWLLGAGYTELIVTKEPRKIARVVASLRQAHRDGLRAAAAGPDARA